MQLRKAIRLLQEAEKKVGPYAHFSIDTKRYKDWDMPWQIDDVVSIDTDYIEYINPDTDSPYENGKARATVILNRY